MAYQVDDLAERGNSLLRRFELTEKKDAVGAGTSRGMRQKVAVSSRTCTSRRRFCSTNR